MRKFIWFFAFSLLPAPPGKVYGCFLRKTCPTRLHGIISSSPPHCQTRNEISKRYGRYNLLLKYNNHNVFYLIILATHWAKVKT